MISFIAPKFFMEKNTNKKIKQVEQATLKTFQEEIPSIYFSDKSEEEFQQYSDNALYTYRDLFKFPPKMFSGVKLIDFGVRRCISPPLQKYTNEE